MSTKVKGEAIKEGSIPLSALNELQKAFIPHCDNVWEMTLTDEYQVFQQMKFGMKRTLYMELL